MRDKITEIKRLIQTNIGSARSAAVPLLKSVTKNGTDKDRSDVFHLMGLIEFYDNNPKEASTWYTKELKLREKINDAKGASDVLNNLGAIYYNQGKLDKAHSYYQNALTYNQAINDPRGTVKIYNNLGAVLLRSGMAAEAYAMHSRALVINRELGDTERIGVSLQNIGHTYLSQGDYTSALANFHEALDIAKATKDTTTAIVIMINIGSTLLKQGHTVEAKRYYEKSHKESLTINYHYGLILSLRSLAYISQTQAKYNKAIEYYTACVEIAQTADHIAEVPAALSGIAMAYASLKDYEKAFKYLNEALKLSRKTGMKEIISEVYTRFSDIYEKLNDYKKSFEYYKKYIAIRDELVNRENTRTINEIKTRYEVEKKEKEAQLLKEKNEAISIYARKLEASNNSLHQFAHVASHDLREPLRMVSSYMGLLEKSMGDNINPTQKQFIGFAVDGAKRMDTLIHDLLHLAKVDADPKVERISLNSVIEEVKKNIQVLLKERNAQIIASDMPAIIADRTQVLQLFQNIITNGIKYNESKKPTVTISYGQHSTGTTLSIADNGIGIAPELRDRAFELFQRVHTDSKYKGSGIGLAICKKIVDSIGGTIAIEANEGGGSIFKITLLSSIIR